jgi:hypothetical protein
MSLQLTKLTDKTQEPAMVVPFGVLDSKGREIGARVAFRVATYTLTEERSGYCIAPGTYFEWLPSATRSGAHYGALQSWRQCATSEERHVAVTEYLKRARKQAHKKLISR